MLHRLVWRKWVLIIFVLLVVLPPATVQAARRFSFNYNLAEITRVCRDGITFYFANDGGNPYHNGVGNWGTVTARNAAGTVLDKPQTLTMALHPETPPGYWNVYALGQIVWSPQLAKMTTIAVTIYFYDTYLNRDAEVTDTFVVTDCSLTQAPPSNFTYQGQLFDGNTPANGQYDFRFRLYNAPTTGQQVGIDYPVPAVGVMNGQFAVKPAFGLFAFDGNPRWLEIAVKPLNAHESAYATLSPRQEIMAVPYALQTLSVPQHQHLGEEWIGNWPLMINGSFHSRDFTSLTPYTTTALSNFGLVVNNTHPQGGGLLTASAGHFTLVAYNGSTVPSVAISGLSENGIAGVFGTRNGDTILGGYEFTAATIEPRFVLDWQGNLWIAGGFSSPAAYRSTGADFAEMLPAQPGLDAGDVLRIGDDGLLTRTTVPNATNVVGVYSTAPGFIGGYTIPSHQTASPLPSMENAGLAQASTGVVQETTLSVAERRQALIDQEVAANAGKIPLAITGIVPVKASAENGPILPGDLLTTSTLPGHAMKATTVDVGGIAIHRPGTIIGKALEGLTEGTGVIRVLITLQ